MNYVSKLFTGTVLLSLSACVVNNTSSTGAGGGDGGSGPSTSSQGGGATTTSSGEGGATNSTTGVGGAGVGGDPIGAGGDGVGGDGVGGMGVGGMGVGGMGTGGGSGCTQITLADLALVGADGDAALYGAELTPNLGGVDADVFRAEFYGPGTGSFDGGLTGTFDLTMNGDDNYATCSRCLRVIDDEDTLYFQSQGTLVIDAASEQLTGFLSASVTNLRLVEVTIDTTTFESTPVPGGACLEIASADLDAGTPLPAAWDCPDNYFNDTFCDCGCGAPDVDCGSDLTVAACDYCITAADGGCAASSTCPSDIDPMNNAVCL